MFTAMLAAFIAIFTYMEKIKKYSLARIYTESPGTTALLFSSKCCLLSSEWFISI